MKTSNALVASEQFFQYLLMNDLLINNVEAEAEEVTTLRFTDKKQVKNLNKFGISVELSSGKVNVIRNDVVFNTTKTLITRPDITIHNKPTTNAIIELKSVPSTLIKSKAGVCVLHEQLIKYGLAHIAKKGTLPNLLMLAYITNTATQKNSLKSKIVRDAYLKLTGRMQKKGITQRVKELIDSEMQIVATFYEGLSIRLMSSVLIVDSDTDEVTRDNLLNNCFIDQLS